MGKAQSVYKEKKNFLDTIGYFIMYLMVGFIPHIYKYVKFTPAASESIYFKEPAYADLYMLAKSRAFLFLTVLLLGVFLYQVVKKHITFIKDKITIGTGIFAVVVILSSVISEYQDLVYWGAKDRFEGMWVWLAYLVVFTIARHYGSNKVFVDRLLKVFVFSASIMAVFGLMQVTGYDIYTEGPLRWLCFPKEMATNMSAYMVSNVTEVGAVGALYNSNYFGVYISVAALISSYFTFKEEKYQVLYFALTLILYAAMIASKSEAALLGFAVAVMFFVISFGKEIWSRRHYAVFIVIAIVVIDRFLAMNLLYGQSGNALWIYLLMITGVVIGTAIYQLLNKQFKIMEVVRKQSTLFSVLVLSVVVAGIYIGVDVTGDAGFIGGVKGVNLKENLIIIESTTGKSIAVKCLEDGINAYDKELNSLKPKVTGDNGLTYMVENIGYELKVKQYSNGYLLRFKAPFLLNVFFDGTNVSYVHPSSGVGQIQYPKRNEYLYENGSAYTNRAYIWSTFIPVATDYIALGTGIDTYLMSFPQNDFIGKTNFYTEGDHILIDKPHSVYLDVMLNTGIIGFLVVIGFVIVVLGRCFYYVSSVRLNRRYLLVLLVVVMMLVAGIFNDSTIPLTLLLSCFGGMGLMTNEEG